MDEDCNDLDPKNGSDLDPKNSSDLVPFNSSNDLDRQNMVIHHQKLKILKCKFCKLFFPTEDHLKEHQLVHEGENPPETNKGCV